MCEFFLKKVAFSYYTKGGGSRFGIKSTKMTLKTREYIVQLIVRHVQGTLDDTGKKELLEWRESFPENEALFQRMTSRVHFEESLKACEMTSKEMESEWKLIYGKTIGRQRLGMRRMFQYAAILIAVVLIGGVWMLGDRDVELPSDSLMAKAHLIKRIKTQAILVMGDGTTVNLKDTSSLASLVSTKVALSANKEILTYTEGSVDTVMEFHTMRIPRGGEYVLVLSDGTTVYLNAESELTYPVKFSGKDRRVYLKGEAYFEVERDTCKPFIVEANSLEIQVLGTEFGVRAYGDEECVRTTLKRGKVSVESEGCGVILTPNMQASFDKKTLQMDVREVNVDLFLGWKDGRLIFDNCSLEDILKDLGKWYDFDVRYAREDARLIPFSLNIKKHDAFAEVLQLLEDTGCVKFDIRDNVVVVK